MEMKQALGRSRIPCRNSKKNAVQFRTAVASDIGKHVTVNGKTAILRYYGNVHFASDTWCGVELCEGNVGKNNGTVRNHQYFVCSHMRGLMVPLAKVVVNMSVDTGEDINSISEMDSASACDSMDNSAEQNRSSRCDGHLLSQLSGERLDVKSSKRNSIEFDDSLGILTPEQMVDTTHDLELYRSPSNDNVSYLETDSMVSMAQFNAGPSLNCQEQSDVSVSLGIIDENHIGSAFGATSTADVNLLLPLTLSRENMCPRLDQTPSPEELPLDTTPIRMSDGHSIANQISASKDFTFGRHRDKILEKTSNSQFIASIASITSLDIGYQGDGEMSRPGSRGADNMNSPLYRRVVPIQSQLRGDPMTDSDFFTESDVDYNEDKTSSALRNQLAVPSVESYESGQTQSDDAIFSTPSKSGIESYSNNRETMDSSGVFTDIESTSSIGSREMNHTLVAVSPSESSTQTISDDSQHRKTPTNSTISSVNVKILKQSDNIKKIPKTPNNTNANNEKNNKKSANKWDHIMSRISKNTQENTPNLRQVKSRVYEGLSTTPNIKDSQKLTSSTTPNNVAKRRVLKSRNILTANQTSKTISNKIKFPNDIPNTTSSKKCVSPNVKPSNGKTRNVKVSNDGSIHSKNTMVSSKNELNNPSKDKVSSSPRQLSKVHLSRSITSTTNIISKVPFNKGGDKHATIAAEALAVVLQHLVFKVNLDRINGLQNELKLARRDSDLKCKELERLKGAMHLKMQLLESEKSVSQKKSVDLEKKLLLVKQEMIKLQRIHSEQLDILREENDAIRDQLDESHEKIKDLQANTYCDAPGDFSDSDHEVRSLRAVLDIKQVEVGDLRKALAEAVQKCEKLPSVEERLSIITARCEDLELQLQRKNDVEMHLLSDIKKLNESVKEEINQNRSLSLHNEELQWKLKQNKEIITKVLERAEETMNRSHLSSIVNDKVFPKASCHSYKDSLTGSLCSSLTRSVASSTPRSRSNSGNYNPLELAINHDDVCNSPLVKGVIKKSDSVSYVIDLEDSPDEVASRIVRRSFRNGSSLSKSSTTPVSRPLEPSFYAQYSDDAKQMAKSSCRKPSSTSSSTKAERVLDDEVFWRNEGYVREQHCSAFKSHNNHLLTDSDDDDILELPALPVRGPLLPPPRNLAKCSNDDDLDDDKSTSSATSSIDQI